MKYKKIIIAISSGSLAAIIVIIGILIIRKNEKLPENSKFLNNDMSGMDNDEVKEVVDRKVNSIFETKKIELDINGKIYSMSASAINTHFDSNDVFKVAKKTEKNEIPEPKYDKSKLEKFLAELAEKTRILPKKYSFKVVNNELIVAAGNCGKEIDVPSTIEKIDEQIKQLQFKKIKAKIKDIPNEETKINLEQIKSKIETKVKEPNFKLVKGKRIYEDEVIGIELDLEKAKQIVKDPANGEYRIPLKVIAPKTTKAQLIESHRHPSVPHTLASFTTTFKTNPNDQYSVNRARNIAIAASAINGIILLPGEEFYFGETAGKAIGYLPATTYINGKKGIGNGGGMCQVSSTLFNAALKANMDITQRVSHSRPVYYVKPGLDATYDGAGTDFRFKNSLKNPILIEAATNDSSVTVAIKGIKLPEEDFKVDINSHVTSDSKELRTAVADVTTTLNGKVVKQRQYNSRYYKNR